MTHPAVKCEVRETWRSNGDPGRLTKEAAYDDAARARIRVKCECNPQEMYTPDCSCRFHQPDDYYSKVRARLARWLMWADESNQEQQPRCEKGIMI